MGGRESDLPARNYTWQIYFTFIFPLQSIFIEYLLGASCLSNPEDIVIFRADKNPQEG